MIKKLLASLTTLTLVCLTLSACNSGSTSSSPSSSNLQFITQPTNTTPAGTTNGFISNVQVEILDPSGNLIESADNLVTLTIGNNPGSEFTLESPVSLTPGVPAYTGQGLFSGVLVGVIAVHAVNGIATFESLVITQPGNGYTLIASADGFTDGTSNAFNVTASTDGFIQTSSNGDGAEIVNLTQIGANFQGYTYVYIAQQPNPISPESFATWSQAGWITNTPRLAVFDYSNTISSPNSTPGPLTSYTDDYGYTWGYVVQNQNYDWPFNPANYDTPESSGWEAGQTSAYVPPGVVKYSYINKDQLYIFSKTTPATGIKALRYFITDEWGNIYTMKSTNRNNGSEESITAAFIAAVLPSGWSKSMGYLPQDLYGFPIYGESTNAVYNDFRDSADNAYTQIVWGNIGNSIAQQIGYPMPIYSSSIGARVNGNVAGMSLMYGSFGDDKFYPESGNNLINGNGGFNGVFYSGLSDTYTITKNESSYTVTGPNGTNDNLRNIQYLQFINESVSLDSF